MADRRGDAAKDTVFPASIGAHERVETVVESAWPRLRPRLADCLELAVCLGDGVRALALVRGQGRLFVAGTEAGWPVTIDDPGPGLTALFERPYAGQWGAEGDGPIAAGELRSRWPQMRRLAIEPLLVGDEPVGLLCLADDHCEPWSAKTLQGLAGLAVVCAAAVDDQCALAEAQIGRRNLEQQVPGFCFEMTESPDGRLRLPYLSARAQVLLQTAPSALGRDAAELFGRIPADQRATIRQNLRTATINEQPVKGLFRLDLLPGRPMWLRGEVRAWRRRDGTIVTTGYLEDATDHVSQVRRADRAQADNVAKSEFIAQLGHEVRTPLAGILGFAQLMRMDQRNPLRGEQRGRLNQIELASHRLLELVSGVLDLARIENGRHQVSAGPVDAVSLLQGTLAMLQPLADAYGTRFEVSLPPTSPMVLAEEGALSQVMTNLLSNAIKYNRRGGRVLVSLQREGQQCRLSVTDEGEGMTVAQLDQLFTPFRRFGKAAQLVEGTGLGLTISRRLVEAMGGQIRVQSTPGKGSRFDVSLPGARIEQRSSAVVGQAMMSPDLTPEKPRNETVAAAVDHPATILVVEDDRLSGLLMRAVFATCPAWTMHFVGSISEAREQFERCRPDLLITDINLPDGSGHALLAMTAARGDLPAVPCIAVSADDSDAQVRASRTAGFADFWPKPIDLQRLVENTARWLAA